jgi:single-stranded-DNA-specific exonuclease
MGIRTRSASNYEARPSSGKIYYRDTNTEVVSLENYSDRDQMRAVAEELGISYYAVATVMTNKSLRGMSTADISALITADIEDRHPLENYPETLEAISIIKDAIASGDSIGIYGDYDGDGVTSSLIVSEALYDLLPENRVHLDFSRVVEDGFSFSERGLNELASKGCKTIIVLDTGTNSPETLKKATEMGIRVIVMDHHPLNDGSPRVEGVTYINPHMHPDLSDEEEMRNAGLSWYFARKLYEETLGTPPEKLHRELLTYAALGTIADAANQLDGKHDRALLHFGLRSEASESVASLPLLMETDGEEFDNTSTPSAVAGFQMLSLAKRVSTLAPQTVYRAISNRTPEAERLAALEEVRSKHSTFITATMKSTDEILKKFSENPGNVVIEVADPETVPAELLGCSGSIAGRVARAANKPAFVFVESNDGSFKGSYRVGSSKMNENEILERLNAKYPDVMEAFGGHGPAGGITIANRDKLTRFTDLMKEFVDYQVKHEPGYVPFGNNVKVSGKRWGDEGRDKLFVTAEVPVADLRESNFEDVFRFTPFSGFSIRKPSYLTKGLTYKSTEGNKVHFGDAGEEVIFTLGADAKNVGSLTVGKIYDAIFEPRRVENGAEFELKNLQLALS